MKKSRIILILCVFAICVGGSGFKRDASRSLKVLTYNIANGRGVDGTTDYQRIADVIIACNPDVAAIQELDSMTDRSNVFVLEEIAKLVNMNHTFRASLERRGGTFGIGVLSKEKPISSRAIPLPGRDEARSLLMVEFQDYVFFATHLSQNGEDRLASVKLINEQIEAIQKPVIFGGDFNATPSSPPMIELRKSWTILNDTTGLTLPPVNPNRCLDYVLLRSTHSAKVIGSRVIDTQAAQWHLPVFVEFEF